MLGGPSYVIVVGEEMAPIASVALTWAWHGGGWWELERAWTTVGGSALAGQGAGGSLARPASNARPGARDCPLAIYRPL